jgi:hypothetical protein
MNLTIPFIVLAIMFVAVVIGWSETWKTKEHYRCRVFDLTDGKEGSNLVKVVPDLAPPPPPKKPAPEGLFPTRPLLVDWIWTGQEFFSKKAVVAMTKNPNGSINVILNNGRSINTGLPEDDAKLVLGISYSATIWDELSYKKKLYGKGEKKDE